MAVNRSMNSFLIVGTQRIGSSALAESIGFHPRIASGAEWTQAVSWHRKLYVTGRVLAADFSVLPKRQHDRATSIMNSRIERLGFRSLFRSSDKWLVHPRFAPALWLDRLEDHIAWLQSHSHVHVIHLIRRDNVAWLRSKFLSRESKSYFGKPYPAGMKVTIPLREAKARLQSKDWVDARLSSVAVTNPYLRVRYEEFLAGSQAVTGSVLRFLGCDPEELEGQKRGLNKQSSEPIDDQILNYDELISLLEENNLRWSRV